MCITCLVLPRGLLQQILTGSLYMTWLPKTQLCMKASQIYNVFACLSISLYKLVMFLLFLLLIVLLAEM